MAVRNRRKSPLGDTFVRVPHVVSHQVDMIPAAGGATCGIRLCRSSTVVVKRQSKTARASELQALPLLSPADVWRRNAGS